MTYNKILIILFFAFNFLLAQNSITYNPETGNYEIVVNNEDTSYTAVFEPATKVDPIISSSISRNCDVYLFEYAVTNQLSSQQRILFFSCDFYNEIEDITNPNEEWQSDKYSYRSTLEWGHTMVRPDGMRSPNSGIAPNDTVGGFSFKSIGLPSIVNAYFAGATSTLSFPDEPPEKVYELLKPLRKFPANTVINKTIGPAAPVKEFDQLTFTDSLLSSCQQSFELGWITDQTTQEKYTTYFQTAQGFLQQNNISEAINTLNTVLQNVQQDSGVTLTSEAYALLYFNTEYLIKRLKK